MIEFGEVRAAMERVNGDPSQLAAAVWATHNTPTKADQEFWPRYIQDKVPEHLRGRFDWIMEQLDVAQSRVDEANTAHPDRGRTFGAIQSWDIHYFGAMLARSFDDKSIACIQLARKFDMIEAVRDSNREEHPHGWRISLNVFSDREIFEEVLLHEICLPQTPGPLPSHWLSIEMIGTLPRSYQDEHKRHVKAAREAALQP